jgi:hypothetical protein
VAERCRRRKVVPRRRSVVAGHRGQASQRIWPAEQKPVGNEAVESLSPAHGARCTARCCKANRRCEPGHRSNLRRGTSSGGPSRCGSGKSSNSRPRLSWHARNKRFRDPRSRGRQAMSPCPPGPDAKQRRQQQLDKQDLRRHHTLRRKGVLSLRHRRRHRSSLNHFRHQGAHSSLRCRLSDDPRRRDPAFCWTHRRPHAHAPHLCEPVLGAALAAEA